MKRRTPLVMLLVLLAALLSACASTKVTTSWKPGDTVVCPHCGREFPLPEKQAK